MRFAGAAFGAQNFMGDTPRYDQLGASATEQHSLGLANDAKNEAEAASAVMRGQAMVESAEAQAEAIRASGQAQGQASMVSGIASGIGGLGGLFRSGGGGGFSGGYGSSKFSSSFGAFQPVMMPRGDQSGARGSGL